MKEKIKELEQEIEALLQEKSEYRDWFEGIREQLAKVPQEERLTLSFDLMMFYFEEMKTEFENLK